jgi:hypothetical protein
MTTTYFGPPNPDYYNPPIEPQNFKPSAFDIAGITLGITTVVTTSAPHNYVIGQLIRTIIPPFYGTYQLNEQTAYVISIPSTTQVTLNLNSTGYNAFIPTPSYGPTPPQIVAVGDINTGLISSTGRILPSTALPGSFQNISPQP